MPIAKQRRGWIPAILATCTVAMLAVSTPIIGSIGSATLAHAQVSAEFQVALEPYGSWQPHPRFGEVWVPYDLPPGWRPYTYGRWVYTDDWGWYWVSNDEEADWGWVTFHYGRWAHDRRLGWFWVPGDEWGPAWVDWRRGDDYVGWAPLPPDEVIYEYDNDPAYWIFVQPRYMIAPRVHTYVLPPQRSVVIFRQTVIVNRTVRIEHRDRGARIAVNPGIAPGIVAAAARQPVQTFRVQPRVLAGTQGVAGAVPVQAQDLRSRGQRGQPRPAGPSPVQATLQPTQTVVRPLSQVPKAQPLGKDERGRLGPTPPRAAQGATVAPAPSPAPPTAPQQNGSPRQLNVPPPPASTTVPRSGPPTTTAPTTTTPPTTSPPTTTAPIQRREERRDLGPPGGAGGSGPPPQPNIVRPIPPQTPPPPPPPQQRQVQPPSSPPPPPPQQRQVQPPPPPPPPQQRQVQPPPQPQRQAPPPPPPAARAPATPPPQAAPPKKPPPKPGEAPPEPPR